MVRCTKFTALFHEKFEKINHKKLFLFIYLDIQAALGNKPNFKAVINEVQQYGGDTSQIIFHIVETNMSGQTRKINANDVFNALNQPNIWPQLQQRHNLESMVYYLKILILFKKNLFHGIFIIFSGPKISICQGTTRGVS